MNEIENMRSVAFKAINALVDRAQSLKVADDEVSEKRVEKTIKGLRQSDELVDSQGQSLLEMMPILRGKQYLENEGELSIVKSILPPEDIDNARKALTTFAAELERLRIEQGGVVKPDLDVDALGLDDIDQVVAERDRLAEEYCLLIAAISRKLTEGDKYPGRLDLGRQSVLVDIIRKASIPLESQPKDEEPMPPPIDSEQTLPDKSPILDEHESLGTDEQASDKGSASESPGEDAPQDLPTSSKADVTNGRSAGQTATKDKCADVVFVIDASGSMRPCFDQLREHIRRFVEPFVDAGFTSLRLGLLAYSANKNYSAGGGYIYRNHFLCMDHPENMEVLYENPELANRKFFTKSVDGNVDIRTFCNRLDRIRCIGDENTPFALDCAADFPFGPIGSTRRAIILFTDEKIEEGVSGADAVGADCCHLEEIMNKIDQRHISLYYFGPRSDALNVMCVYPRVFFREVAAVDSNDSGIWDALDFGDVLGQVGKSVSSSFTKNTPEPQYERAVFGQDKWGRESWA